MAQPDPPDIWALIFEQTPAVLRWTLGVLTCGIFTLASVLYRWHRNDMDRIEQRMDRIEDHLVEIAKNTGPKT